MFGFRLALKLADQLSLLAGSILVKRGFAVLLEDVRVVGIDGFGFALSLGLAIAGEGKIDAFELGLFFSDQLSNSAGIVVAATVLIAESRKVAFTFDFDGFRTDVLLRFLDDAAFFEAEVFGTDREIVSFGNVIEIE